MLKKRVLLAGSLIILSIISVLTTTGAVSASNQTWYLCNDFQLKTDNPTGGHTVNIGSTPLIWKSEQAAQGDVTFGPGDWTGGIEIQGGTPGDHYVMVEVGYYQGNRFYPQGPQGRINANGNFTIRAPGFTIPGGGWMAIRIHNRYTRPFGLRTGFGGSWFMRPFFFFGSPLPELASSILLASGFGGLGAYICWRQRRKHVSTA